MIVQLRCNTAIPVPGHADTKRAYTYCQRPLGHDQSEDPKERPHSIYPSDKVPAETKPNQ